MMKCGEFKLANYEMSAFLAEVLLVLSFSSLQPILCHFFPWDPEKAQQLKQGLSRFYRKELTDS